MVTVGKWALVLELALSKQLPVSAHLSFIFQLILLYEVVSFLFRAKMLLWFFDGSFFILLIILPLFDRSVLFRNFLAGIFVLVLSKLRWCIWVVVNRVLANGFLGLAFWQLQRVCFSEFVMSSILLGVLRKVALLAIVTVWLPELAIVVESPEVFLRRINIWNCWHILLVKRSGGNRALGSLVHLEIVIVGHSRLLILIGFVHCHVLSKDHSIACWVVKRWLLLGVLRVVVGVVELLH